MKMAGPRMPKGQLCRVLWPGNSWMRTLAFMIADDKMSQLSFV